MKHLAQFWVGTTPKSGSIFGRRQQLTAKASAVLNAAAAGEIAPTQAAQLIAALGTLAKISEVDELAARIEKLEAARDVT